MINYAYVLYQYQNHVFQNIHKHKTMNLENNVIWFDGVMYNRIIKVIYKRVNIDSIFVLLIFLFFVCYVLCVLYILTDKCIKICNAINYQFFLHMCISNCCNLYCLLVFSVFLFNYFTVIFHFTSLTFTLPWEVK